MTTESSSARIIAIECIYLGEVLHEPRLKLPDCRSNPNLNSYYEAVCYDDRSHSRYPCVVNLIGDELTLIFSGTCEPAIYYVHDRVEYYYNRNSIWCISKSWIWQLTSLHIWIVETGENLCSSAFPRKTREFGIHHPDRRQIAVSAEVFRSGKFLKWFRKGGHWPPLLFLSGKPSNSEFIVLTAGKLRPKRPEASLVTAAPYPVVFFIIYS